MSKLYRPSSGTEGGVFIAQWCEKCVNHDFDDDSFSCDILLRSFACDVDDELYPEEWQYNEDNEPVCTDFSTDLEDSHYRCAYTKDLFDG